MSAPALLIDTYSLFFRAFHALPSMTTRAGEPTSALYGFSSFLLKLLRERPGAAVAFALDAPQATFRHDRFEVYKAGRPATPAPLAAQFGRLAELMATLDVPSYRCPGFEADDVLATLAKVARERAHPALVVSGDRDLLQLAHGSVQVYFVGRRGKDAQLYDEAAVRTRFGVAPQELPTFRALIGDPSDNLPGVPGIGASTAQKLLVGRRSASELLGDLAGVKSARLRETLSSHAQQILHMELLSRLREDAPIDGGLEPWAVPSVIALSRLGALFEQLEFKSLQARLSKLLG